MRRAEIAQSAGLLGGDALDQRLGQPRLADARFGRNQHDPALAALSLGPPPQHRISAAAGPRTPNATAEGDGSQTCMGLFLSSSHFWLVGDSLFGAGMPFFVPSPAIRFAERAEGVKGPKRLAKLGGLPLSGACVSQRPLFKPGAGFEA